MVRVRLLDARARVEGGALQVLERLLDLILEELRVASWARLGIWVVPVSPQVVLEVPPGDDISHLLVYEESVREALGCERALAASDCLQSRKPAALDEVVELPFDQSVDDEVLLPLLSALLAELVQQDHDPEDSHQKQAE